MSYVKGEAAGQSSLFPVSLSELVPHDHVARVIEVYVDRLDLAALGFTKTVTKRTGPPPYCPGDSLKLYHDGYLHRIHSSRRLKAKGQRNIEVMCYSAVLCWITRFIAVFRRTNSKGFTALCRALVQFCRRAGLIADELVAIDGSKFQAVASRRQLIAPARLTKQEQSLDKRIGQYLQQLDEADKAETSNEIDRTAVPAASLAR